VSDNSVVEVLSDGSTVVEDVTTPEEEEYYVQIQGSDRKYPAIVLRRKDRGKGATILTISKNGQHSDLYAEYEEAISAYVVRRNYNTTDNRENPTTRLGSPGSFVLPPQGWDGETIPGVVTGRGNGAENPL
jgi:hypothetical protein